MTTSEKLIEYLQSEENRLMIDTNAQILVLKELVEELYCNAKSISSEAFKEIFQTSLESNRQFLFDREMKVVEELKAKEARE